MKTTIPWKLRQRFGITAPRVAVRAQIPWYARWLAIVLLAGVAGAAALWVFDAGLQFAGYDLRESTQERTALKRELESARAELERLRAIANASDSKLSIERTAQQNLAQQVRTLEADNAKLREETAIFESMLASESRNGNLLSIRGLKLEPMQGNEYRYRMLVVASALGKGNYRGRYDLQVRLTREGRSAMIALPEASGPAAGFSLEFKHFQRVEGTFKVPPAAHVDSVEVRIYDAGSTQVRATEIVQPG